MRTWMKIVMAGAVPVVGLGGLALVPGSARAELGLTASAATTSHCWSTRNPAIAKKLSSDVYTASRKAAGSISIAVYDRKRGITCYINSGKHYDSASTIKATVLAAVLRRAQEQHRGLTAWEKAQAVPMITRSDNDSTTRLWKSLGMKRVRDFLKLAGMTHTTLNPGGAWGLTQETAYDELTLLKLLTTHGTVLTDASRAYELSLMHQVIPSQRWGTPAGRPSGIVFHVKNGWLPRSTHAWRVHSLGTFTGRGQDYQMAILTWGDSTMSAGISSIERVARVVHRDLNPGASFSAERSLLQAPYDQSPDEPQIP